MRGLVIAGVVVMLASAQANEGGGDGPPVSREMVQEILAKEKEGWAKKIGERRPRLYFTESRLNALQDSWKNATGQKRELLDAALSTAQRISRAPAPAYIDPDKAANPWYARNELWQRDVGDSIVALTFGSLIAKDPEKDAKLREFVLTACRYPTWGRVGPNIDLACAHLARGVAVAWDWRPDLWTPDDRALIISTITERVHALLEGNYGKVAWSRGYNENHHHVALAALGLCGLSFYNDIPEAPEWLAASVAGLRNTAIYACADGSSPEGVPYWSYSVSFLLQLMEGIASIVDMAEFYEMPVIKDAASYRLNSSAPGLASVVPWGDAVNRDFYGPHPILYRLASQYNDTGAQWLAQELPFAPQGSIDVPMWAFLWYDPAVAVTPPAKLDHVLTEGNIATMRSGWADGDILFSVKAGYTNRNHSHLDAGALVLSIGDEWLLTTPGYGEGRHDPEFWKTDGPRWEYLSNATESHSTLVINGRNQRFDGAAHGVISRFVSLPNWIWTDVDLREAYADISSADRAVLHRRGEYFLVADTVRTPKSVQVEWLAQAGKPARVDGPTLSIVGQNGDVSLTALAPAEPFVRREPRSAKRDVPVGKLETYAISAEGSDVGFLVFGQITKRPGLAAGMKARLISSNAEKQVIEVVGTDWKDAITFRKDASVIPLGEGTEDTVTAERAVVRTRGATLLGVSAVMAKSMKSEGFDFALSQPGDFELSKVAESAWLLTFPADVSGSFRWPDGLKLTALDASGSDIPGDGAKRTLSAGSYALHIDEAGLASVRARLVPKFTARGGREVQAPPAQPPLPSTERVASEAEAFAREGNGTVEIVEKIGASGTSLRGFGNESNRHWIAWKFPITTAGKYHLKVRYCTAAEYATASVLLDGTAVSKGALKVPFPATGGWSSTRSDWQDVILKGADGKEIVFDLSAGDHEIVMTDPTAAINLDALELIGTSGEGAGDGL